MIPSGTIALRRLLLTAALAVCGSAARAESKFIGKWSDNASQGSRIGNLTISKDTAVFERVAIYTIASNGTFGLGEIFKISGVNHSPDPEGCGPNGKVNYIVVLPVSPSSGTRQQAIKVIFYSGTTPPSPETINDDREACSIHPFGRN